MSFPAREHALKTCKELSKLIKISTGSQHYILLEAESITFRNDTDRELAFRQESNYFYLTGCHVPGSVVLISFLPSSEPSDIDMKLFIPEASLDDMTWSVPPPSLAEAKEKYDPSFSISYLDALASVIPKAESDTIHVLPSSENLPSPSTHIKDTKAQVDDSSLLHAIHEARITKTAEEIELIRTANAISSRAHETVMRVLGRAVKLGLRSSSNTTGTVTLPGDWLIEKEAEAEALFVAACRREGGVHQAYLPICASAHRSSTLHYCCNGGNDKEFAWGPIAAASRGNTGSLNHTHSEDNSIVPQVLLIDAGCEYSCYSADITRTIPVGNGGKFTKESGEIYVLVWNMQDAAFAMIKAGVAWEDVHLKCHEILAQEFLKLGIFKSPSAKDDDYVKEILDSGITTAFFPHGLGHSLGMDVHDVPSASKPEGITPPQGKGHAGIYRFLRLRRKLETGMVVTVEPGCYFSPHLLAPVWDSPYINADVLRKYAGTGVEGDKGMGGVRIEDAVVILDSGYENLTTVRSDRDWIEGVCSGEL